MFVDILQLQETGQLLCDETPTKTDQAERKEVYIIPLHLIWCKDSATEAWSTKT